jgi:hypothetical protein
MLSQDRYRRREPANHNFSHIGVSFAESFVPWLKTNNLDNADARNRDDVVPSYQDLRTQPDHRKFGVPRLRYRAPD